MNVEIGTVAVQLLFLEYFFRIFGIGSLQCSYLVNYCAPLMVCHEGTELKDRYQKSIKAQSILYRQRGMGGQVFLRHSKQGTFVDLS
jgi:hypothetical protein